MNLNLKYNYYSIVYMEFKELLNRLSLPVKPKQNEEDIIKTEEGNISEVILNVEIEGYYINININI